MKKTRFFAYGMFGAALTFALVLAGCENGVSPVSIDGTVDSTAIDAPAVTAAAVTGGVRLSWDPIVDASGYQVWRRDANTSDKQLGGPQLDTAANKYVYADLVADGNPLTANTEYTYTVVAIATSSTRENGKWNGTATPTAIPAKGSQLAAPAAVVIDAFDEDGGKVSVTVTAPAGGNIPPSYSVSLYREGVSNAVATGSFDGNKGDITWNAGSQVEGTYTVKAVGTLPASSGGGSPYYLNSAAMVSAGKPFTKVFGSGDSLYVLASQPIIDNTNTITKYKANISGSFTSKSGYTYTLERAPVDAVGDPGTYAAVAVSKLNPDGTYTSTGVTISTLLEKDALDQPKNSTLYDTAITPGTFTYRIKAVNGTQTKYLPSTSNSNVIVTIDPLNYVSGQISIGAPTEVGTGASRKLEYTITPSPSFYKNALQANDKLVVYWATSSNSNGYLQGIYTAANSKTFNKTQLEAGTAQSIQVPYILTSYDNVFVVAYLETASDKKIYVESSSMGGGGGSSNYTWNWNQFGGDPANGIQNVTSYSINNELRYAATLNTYILQ